MKIELIKNFDSCQDPIKTEETIFNQLVENQNNHDLNFTYVAFPICDSINKSGLAATQKIIDKICQEQNSKKETKFFVCQHILVDKLNFYNNLVFTPHATKLNSFIPIPHFSYNYNEDLIKPWEEREYTFSFAGSFVTHPVRKRIYELLKDRKDCFVQNTGNWHFENTPAQQKENSLNYIKLLGNTKFSLCPRGTGPASIRIWESLLMESHPVVISDFLKMPLEYYLEKTPWSRLPESLKNINNINKKIDLNLFNNKNLFNNENLYKTIILNLNLFNKK
jgi:hypothetical protein